jgi:hypothetical protein
MLNSSNFFQYLTGFIAVKMPMYPAKLTDLKTVLPFLCQSKLTTDGLSASVTRHVWFRGSQLIEKKVNSYNKVLIKNICVKSWSTMALHFTNKKEAADTRYLQSANEVCLHAVLMGQQLSQSPARKEIMSYSSDAKIYKKVIQNCKQWRRNRMARAKLSSIRECTFYRNCPMHPQ